MWLSEFMPYLSHQNETHKSDSQLKFLFLKKGFKWLDFISNWKKD
jgi:hypothetical protein